MRAVLLKKLRKRRVYYRIFIISLLVSVLSLMLVSIFSIQIYSQAITSRMQEKEQNYLDLYSANVTNALKNIDMAATTYTQLPQVQDFLSQYRLRPTFITPQSLMPAVSIAEESFFPYDPIADGYIITNTGSRFYVYSEGYSDLALDELNYDVLLKKTHSQLTPAAVVCNGAQFARDKGQNRNGVFYIKRIINENGDNLGYLLLYLDKAKLLDMNDADGSEENQNNRIIIDSYGDIVYSSGDRYAEPIDESVNLFLAQQNSSGRKSFVLHEDTFLGWNSSLYVGISNIFFDWDIVTFIPYNMLLPEIMSNIKITIIILVASILLCTLTARLISKSIIEPVNEITASLNRIQQGDFVPAAQALEKDELANVQNMINETAVRISELIDQIKRSEEQANHLRFQALQAQINPHFFVNALDSIIWLSNLQSSYNISNLATSLTRLLTICLQNNDLLIPISDELELAKSYVNIMQYRYLDPLNIFFETEAEIEKCLAPRFIIQPFIENCLMHGLDEEGISAFEIYVSVHSENGDVICCVHDNGRGIEQKRLDQVQKKRAPSTKRIGINSIGISNVDERIKLQFGDDYGVKIESISGEGTTVSIRIPKLRREG